MLGDMKIDICKVRKELLKSELLKIYFKNNGNITDLLAVINMVW